MKVIVFISAALLFGYWAYLWIRFGIRDCLSRYSASQYPAWSYVLTISAMLLIPAMLDLTEGKTLQFVAFFAPVSLLIVGITPHWATSSVQYIVHHIGVGLAVLFSVIFTVLFHGLVWFILIAAVAAAILGLLWRKYWLWFAELCIYAAMYAAILYLLFR